MVHAVYITFEIWHILIIPNLTILAALKFVYFAVQNVDHLNQSIFELGHMYQFCTFSRLLIIF